MQNARSTPAISHASEGYHFSHDALATCKLPIEDLDIDHMAVNIPVNNESAENVLKSFMGNAVQLETDKGRLWHILNKIFLYGIVLEKHNYLKY
jgi:hypothetical protein